VDRSRVSSETHESRTEICAPDSSHAERDLNRYLELADTLLNTNTEEHRRNTD
jgi:hypothetical protein